MTEPITIRPAREDDVAFAFSMIVELADYERAPDQVRGSPALLHAALFGSRPVAEALIAERGRERIGWAVFHSTFSTWECREGIWLEDLYVRPEHRRGGTGEALLRAVAAIAVERGCARLEWVALDWNALALSFYEKLGAEVLEEWKLHRLSGEALGRVAGVGASAT